MSQLLAGKVAIVTGGSSGIGLASVEKFLESGAQVMVGDIRDDAGAALVERLGDRVAYTHTDVSRESDVAALVQATVDRFGRLDVMFNNAGAQGDPAGIADIEQESFEATLSLLTSSVALGHKYAAAQFRKQGSGGSIISTASIAGFLGSRQAAGYTVAKHAVRGVVHQAAAELADDRIRSNAIAPGVIMTPIMASTFGVGPDQADEFMEFLEERISPSQHGGRVGKPEDIANVALFLASDLSGYVNGVTIPVDGGGLVVSDGSFLKETLAAAEAFPRK